MVTFKRNPEADKIILSATTLIKLLLANRGKDVDPKHTWELLRILLWKITEAEAPKYETRHQSERARNYREKGQLRHDHVYQCHKMIGELLEATPEGVDSILGKALGCTVTLEEHIQLNKFDDSYGWERYRRAGILAKNIETDQSPY